MPFLRILPYPADISDTLLSVLGPCLGSSWRWHCQRHTHALAHILSSTFRWNDCDRINFQAGISLHVHLAYRCLKLSSCTHSCLIRQSGNFMKFRKGCTKKPLK